MAIEVVDVRDLVDLVFAALRYRGHGAGSATPFEAPLWQIVHWRRGKWVRWRSYGTQAEALEAVGLSA